MTPPEKVVEGLDWESAGRRVDGHPHSIYQILRHMLSWAWWALEGMRGGEFQRTKAEEEGNFFPPDPKPASPQAWEETVRSFQAFLKEAKEFLPTSDPKGRHSDWEDSSVASTWVMIVAHNAYHLGAIVTLRRILGLWG
ncbi:MAG: DinB family protein [bacterium]